MLDQDLEAASPQLLELETSDVVLRNSIVLNQFLAGIGWELYKAAWSDLRRLNPYVDAAAEFWFPIVEGYVPNPPSKIPPWIALRGGHLREVATG